MSQLAPFVDAAVSIDRTAWTNTFISYYTWGAALGLALDLSLRDKTAGKAGIDDYMRLMWTSYGVPGMKAAPGMVARTYSREDLQGRLAQLSGDGAFAAGVLRPVRPGPRRARLRAAVRPDGPRGAQARAGPRRGSATPPLHLHQRRPARRASCPSTRRSTRPASPRTTRFVSLAGVEVDLRPGRAGRAAAATRRARGSSCVSCGAAARR